MSERERSRAVQKQFAAEDYVEALGETFDVALGEGEEELEE